jgi:hypothetical protein
MTKEGAGTITKILTMALLLLAVACSDDGGGGGSEYGVPNEINECATPHATYLHSCTERASGTCGPIQDQLQSIDDPMITAARCDSITQENCTARASKCRQSVEVAGYSCIVTETYVTTFESDGSRAEVIDSRWIECDDGSFCSSTYDCTMTRQ